MGAVHHLGQPGDDSGGFAQRAFACGARRARAYDVEGSGVDGRTSKDSGGCKDLPQNVGGQQRLGVVGGEGCEAIDGGQYLGGVRGADGARQFSGCVMRLVLRYDDGRACCRSPAEWGERHGRGQGDI